ncbi:sensor histidine kinase, partial [Streptomyces sp. S6]
MIRAIRPLLRGSTYSGTLFAYGGALASLPLLPFALLPALAWSSAPEGARIVLVLLVWAALIGVAGLAPATRRVLIASARRLLRVPLPDPVAVPRPAIPSGADRLRTPLWLLLHVALGWAGALVNVLILVGVVMPGGWLGVRAGLDVFGEPVWVTGGWGSWVLALGCVLSAAAVCVAVAGALRRL